MDKMSGSDDKIHAGFNQFKKAFRDHWENGLKGEDPSHYLLRFYSVECGLKSMININSPREIHRSHEAWRYGVKMDQTKEKLLLEWFDKAEKYIKDYLQEAI
ncbi:MAG: hypothetical protein NTY37_09910 [Methanothrix sp.]|nr:hypothetical protein [Methanothrix sp.]